MPNRNIGHQLERQRFPRSDEDMENLVTINVLPRGFLGREHLPYPSREPHETLEVPEEDLMVEKAH